MGFGTPTPRLRSLAALRLDVDAGLGRVAALEPRRGYVDGGFSFTALTGPQAWLEAGYQPLAHFSLFSRAFATPDDAGLMAGLHFDF